jgi:hypothetical protein
MRTAFNPSQGRKRQTPALFCPFSGTHSTEISQEESPPKKDPLIAFFKLPRLGAQPHELKKGKSGVFRFALKVRSVWVNFKVSGDDFFIKSFAGREKPIVAEVTGEESSGHIVVLLSVTKAPKKATHTFDIIPHLHHQKEGDIIFTTEKMRGVSILLRKITK